jgi:hypothetical protein
MTPDEIKEKSAQLAALYTSKANGKTLQYSCGNREWEEVSGMTSPDMRSDLSRWRVKPEPRRMWVLMNENEEIVDTTRHQAKADAWRIVKNYVTEWVEVLP